MLTSDCTGSVPLQRVGSERYPQCREKAQGAPQQHDLRKLGPGTLAKERAGHPPKQTVDRRGRTFPVPDTIPCGEADGCDEFGNEKDDPGMASHGLLKWLTHT